MTRAFLAVAVASVLVGTAAAPINLPFCTPVGWTQTGPSPVPGTRGTTAANCSTNNPRTSDLAAFLAVYNRTNPAIRDAAGNLVPGGGAFHPRLPRYVNSEQDTERAGGSLSLTWKPGENTTLSLDGLFSRYQQERRDNYILGLSFGRNLSNNGQPMVSIRDVEFDALTDAARRAEPRLHQAHAAGGALGCASGDGIDAGIATRGIRSVGAGRSALGIHVLPRPLQVRAERGVPPAQRAARLRLLCVVVRHGLAVRRKAGEAVVFVAIGAELPADAVDLADGGRGSAEHVAAACFDLGGRGRLAAGAGNDVDGAGDRIGPVERAL